MWYLDSFFSNPSLFTSLGSHNKGSVTLTDNDKGKIIRNGTDWKYLSCIRTKTQSLKH